jgi:hypothetical protein
MKYFKHVTAESAGYWRLNDDDTVDFYDDDWASAIYLDSPERLDVAVLRGVIQEIDYDPTDNKGYLCHDN